MHERTVERHAAGSRSPATKKRASLSRVVTTRAYLATKKGTRKNKKRKENQLRRNPYARVRRYKITSTLRLLLRGDPQDEGLRGLQPRARLSKLDYFYAGITSTRLHRQG